MQVTSAQMIRGYTPPDWQIELVGGECDQDELDAINAEDVIVIASNLRGWGHTHLIRVNPGDYPDNPPIDYIANVKE